MEITQALHRALQHLDWTILALGGVTLGGLVYLAASWLLRVPELRQVIGGVTRRLKQN